LRISVRGEKAVSRSGAIAGESGLEGHDHSGMEGGMDEDEPEEEEEQGRTWYAPGVVG
jgi:hypothetical protein